ncbi:hypothetical protein ACF0H5_008319 [Mactra antiquata]
MLPCWTSTVIFYHTHNNLIPMHTLEAKSILHIVLKLSHLSACLSKTLSHQVSKYKIFQNVSSTITQNNQGPASNGNIVNPLKVYFCRKETMSNKQKRDNM